MFRKLIPLVVVSLWVVVVQTPQKASASTRLTRAVVQNLRNWVQLMPQNRPKRRARRRDTMTPGDGLSTGRASLADLRFNDGSLARIGERAVFKFVPRTRTFRLSSGTVLLLIPPGQGKTRVRTRSAAATIRGSALFVRYDNETDTTVVGSLTNSGIEVFNRDESRSQVLKAGQLIVVVKGRIQGLYNFDLRTFYDTSDLVRGLDLTSPSDRASGDPAMASVQAETSEALAKQVPIVGDNVVKNPSFIELSPVSSSIPDQEVATDSLTVDSFVDPGQIISNTSKKNENKSFSNNVNSPTVQTPTPQTPTVKPQTPTVQTPTVKPQTPTVKPQTPTVKPQTPTPQTPSVEVEPPTVEPQTPSVEVEPPTVEPQIPSVEVEPPTVEPQIPSVEVEPPTVEPQIPSVEVEPPTVEPQI
ncbi:MAG: FecR domain-containing protein, partial [Cyanobacteria bacterium P01_D01_bin.50]